MEKVQLRKHQVNALNKASGKEAFAYLMEQGTGKTCTILTEASRLFNAGEITGLLVLAPNTVHSEWLGEAEKFVTVPYKAVAWDSSLTKAKTAELVALFNAPQDTLKILTVNVEAMSASKAIKVVHHFLEDNVAMTAVDESTRIKNIDAKRTKNIVALRDSSKYRRIATGTPVTQSPLDLFAQFMFLDEKIIGMKNFFMFKARYAVQKEIVVRTRGRYGRPVERKVKKVVGVRNVDELYAKIAPYSFMVSKEECLDLPEKVYQTRSIPLGKTQRKLYNEVRSELMSELDGNEVTVTSALTKLIRLQQIAGGFFTADDGSVTPVPDNRGITELLSLLEETRGGVIIWARFRPELAAIAEALRKEYPDQVVEYHGGVSNDDKKAAIRAFQNKDVRFFVANQQSAGTGLTLTAANTAIYYSQSFSLEERLQSEDRCHRIGTTNRVTYITFVRDGTVDDKINAAFKNKSSFLDALKEELNEGGRSWL